MKFEQKSFTSRPSNDAYLSNLEATFGKKEEIETDDDRPASPPECIDEENELKSQEPDGCVQTC